MLSYGFFFSRRNAIAVAFILGLGVLQFIVHVWAIFALRAGNEEVAEKEDGEWAFGPTVAIVTLVGMVVEGLTRVGRKYSRKKLDNKE